MSIIHSVIFTLKHPVESETTKTFLEDGRKILSAIPSVQNFKVLKQVSVKNSYQFGFSMEFEDQVAYDEYNNHPAHTAFVKDRWEIEVAEFLEIDYEDIK